MKTVLVVLLLIAFFVGAGYYGLPFVVEKETSDVKSEIANLKERLQKAEEFIKKEEEARKVVQLQPDADVQKVIKAVNALSSRMTSLENSFSKDMASTNEAMKKQTGATEETLRNTGQTQEDHV
jgi:cell division septum initiation protein DivIVA